MTITRSPGIARPRHVALVTLLALAACSRTAVPSLTETPSASAAPATAATASATPLSQAGVVFIEAAEQYFNPEVVTVGLGTTVVWKDVQGTHDMVADDRSFASAVLFEGGSYSHQFITRGRYRYICTLHVGAGMWAEVDVE